MDRDEGKGLSANNSSLAPAPKPIRRNRLEASFLAPVLEIQEKPPSPTARITLLSLILLVALALLWASLSEVDVIAVARGKIIPDERTKVVQAATGGVVVEILVANGDAVTAGQPLFLVDPTNASASLAQVQAQHRAATLEWAMHDRLVAADASSAITPPQLAGVPELKRVAPEHIRRQQELVDEVHRTHLDALEGISLEIEALSQQRETELRAATDTEELILSHAALARAQEETASNELRTLAKLLPLAKDEFESLRRLQGNQVVSQQQVNRAEEKYATIDGNLAKQQDRLIELRAARELRTLELQQKIAAHRRKAAEIEAALRSREQARKRARSEFRRLHAADREQSLREIDRLAEDLVKLERERRAHTIVAPADGRAQQLALHTVGGVVQPSQELLVVVPEEPRLRAEVLIENKDIGFIDPGDEVAVKVDTFSYAQYGLVDGEILHISADALQEESLGLVYVADVALATETLVGAEGEVSLAPGMSVAAEIKLGKRTVLEYILDPFIEAGRESMRER